MMTAAELSVGQTERQIYVEQRMTAQYSTGLSVTAQATRK